MAFRIPNFNLFCNVWTSAIGPWPPAGAPRIGAQKCQMYADHFTAVDPGFATESTIIIRFPALTDVRDRLSTSGADLVECPQGSRTWWVVRGVYDVAKGFANEYRVATVVKGQCGTPML